MTQPTLRFNGYSIDWSNTTIKEFFTIFNGYAFKSDDSTDKGCRWIKIADVGINQIKDRSPSYLPKGFSEKFQRFVLKEGDIVMALTRPILNKKLKIARLGKEYTGALLNQRVGKIDTENNIDFVRQKLQSYKLLSQIEARIAGTDPPNLSPSEINSIKISIPSISEQQKIASFLSAVDEKLKQLTKKKSLLEDYKKGVMQKIFSQEIRFKDENGNNYPGWEEKKLGEVCKINKGVQFNKSLLSETGSYPCINGGIDPSGFSEKFNAKPNTITVSEGGNSCGFVSLIRVSFWSGGHCYTIENIDIAVDLLYLYNYLKFNQKRIMALRQGGTLPGLPKKDLLKFIIKKPSFSEQNKIGLLIDSLNDKIELVNSQIENTKAFKKGLLQQMFV